MNKLLPILLVVVLSGCSSEPPAHSTTEPMYFMCGEIPVIVDIKEKSILTYNRENDTYYDWIYRGVYYYKWSEKSQRLNYFLSGWTKAPGSVYSRWVQNSDGDYIILDDSKIQLTCERVSNHNDYINAEID